MSSVFRIPSAMPLAQPPVDDSARLTWTPSSTSHGFEGMVAAPHHLASQAGLRMLQSGGSAVDAAIAANLVLSVVYPDMCGAGGDLFALVWIPGEEAPYCLDAAGTGGQGHDLPSYMLRYPNGPPLYGPASVTIPGAPAGWIELHRRFGKLPLAEVFSEAIHYARYGVACPDRLTASMEHWAPPLTTVQFEGGRAAAGVRMRMRAYAQSLELLVAEGPTGVWTHGLGRAIETVTSGLVTEGDLVGYQPRWVEPLHKQVFGRDWWTVPPPSQGYIALLAADVLERLRSTWDLDDPGLWHHMIESIKVAANDRDLVLGDGSVPAAFSEASERARKIQAQAAPFAGPAETGDTVYLNTVDKSGMGVSLVQSLFHPWGSRVQLSEHGIILQNRGSSFDIRPGNPNLMGVGRRPRSTLSPSVVTSSGHLRALIGTMGGDVQPQVLLQLLVGTQLAGLEPGHALAHPRFYIHRGLAPSIWSGPQPVLGLEDRFHPSIVKDLTQRGHPVRVGAPFVELAGHAQIIQTQGAGTLLSGAADPRSGASGVAAW